MTFRNLALFLCLAFTLFGCGGGDDDPTTPVVSDVDADGYTVEQGDCNDNDASIYPEASEVPDDGIDQDCDGSDLIETIVVEGHLDMGGDDSPNDYQIFNSYESVTTDSTGSFNILVASNKTTFTYAISSSGNKIYTAVAEPRNLSTASSGVNSSYSASITNINAQSTAEAMVLLNPLIITNDQDKYLEIIQIVKSDPAVEYLASVIEYLYVTSEDPLGDAQLESALTDAVVSVVLYLQNSNLVSSAKLDYYKNSKTNNNFFNPKISSTFISTQADWAVLSLQNSTDSTIKIDVSSTGPFGTKTNVDWVVKIIELDVTKRLLAVSCG